VRNVRLPRATPARPPAPESRRLHDPPLSSSSENLVALRPVPSPSRSPRPSSPSPAPRTRKRTRSLRPLRPRPRPSHRPRLQKLRRSRALHLPRLRRQRRHRSRKQKPPAATKTAPVAAEPAAPAPAPEEEPAPALPPAAAPPPSNGASMPLWPEPASDASALQRQGDSRSQPKTMDEVTEKDRVYAEDWWSHARPNPRAPRLLPRARAARAQIRARPHRSPDPGHVAASARRHLRRPRQPFDQDADRPEVRLHRGGSGRRLEHEHGDRELSPARRTCRRARTCASG
jgi:hypothetical protein